jgi:hypothetical protein
MITLAFQCRFCGIDNICAVRSTDDVSSLETNIPIRLSCWACKTPNLILRTLPREAMSAASEPLFAYCLRTASACRRRAIEVPDGEQRNFFLRMEAYWLRLGGQSQYQQRGDIVPVGPSRR